jgi:hypothetical protein
LPHRVLQVLGLVEIPRSLEPGGRDQLGRIEVGSVTAYMASSDPLSFISCFALSANGGGEFEDTCAQSKV